MEWYNFLAAFFGGAFTANAIPHFVTGICGNKFPTPFSTPRGVGLSSSTLNVGWGLFNFLLGYYLLTLAAIHYINLLWLTGFIGFAILSLLLSIRFQAKHKE